MNSEIARPPVEAVVRPEHQIGIVVSNYNPMITSKLEEGAVRTFREAGVPNTCVVVARVPGAWELPFAAQRFIMQRRVLGVVALGAVIQGETTHDEHINRAVSTALMQLSLDHNKPIAFGLLTVRSLDQAIQRSGGNLGNKGEECAQALLECIRLGSGFDQWGAQEVHG